MRFVCLLTLAVTLAAGIPLSSNPPPPLLEHWVGELAHALPELTLLDLTLPGTHDTLTFDLSTTVGDNTSNIPPWLAWILHTLGGQPGRFATWLQAQASTQHVGMTGLLNSGIRFIDFRIDYTRPPRSSEAQDASKAAEGWYGLHFLETVHPAKVYLEEMAQWLRSHPREVAVLWLSRHSSTCATGTDAYPHTTPSERQAFWKEIERVFEGMLFDTRRNRLNETRLETLIESNQRCIVYAGDYAEFTARSPFAMDACQHIDIYDPPTGVMNQPQTQTSQLGLFANATRHLADTKQRNVFWQMFLSTSTPTKQVESTAELTFQPLRHSAIVAKCAASFNIPNMTACPRSLRSIGRLTNYYNQRTLETALARGYAFPNAVYLDTQDADSTLPTYVHEATPQPGYAWIATLLLSTLRHHCASQASCESLLSQLVDLRKAFPARYWEDETNGRLLQWPPLPGEITGFREQSRGVTL